MFTGAGTILNCDDLRRAMDAGARFAVAPGFNPQIIAMARINCIPFVPGIATPSELEQAYAAGCSFLKFFPAEAAGGVKMLKAMTAPYRHLGIKFMPTGGVTQENVAEYLAIPEVAAVGGTWLTNRGVSAPDILPLPDQNLLLVPHLQHIRRLHLYCKAAFRIR